MHEPIRPASVMRRRLFTSTPSSFAATLASSVRVAAKAPSTRASVAAGRAVIRRHPDQRA